jgi:multiple sugar transport system ATP-binding protein
MASVVLRHLAKTYPNGVRAVHDLNLEIIDGEFIVLVGPSGCGKSTTLRMIAGLEEATFGEIHIAGRLVNRVAPGDRDIAMVFQNHALYPHMTVYENMAFGLKMRRLPRADIADRVAGAARILSIETLLERRPRDLSGGQQQRVALGRAIVREPKVFLFDEPLSNLDATLRVQMRAEIARLHRRLKTTVIYVTHDQVEAMTLGERIALVNHGVIQQVDTPMNIYRRPASLFVASLIGSPAMNLFPGRLVGGVFQFAGAGVPGVDLHSAVPNGSVVLGIRPEELLADGGLPLGPVTLVLVEHLGHETIVHFDLAGGRYTARLPAAAQVQTGSQLTLGIRQNAFHLFDSDDGRRLN